MQRRTAFAAVAALALAACAPQEPSGPGTIVDVAADNGNFTTLVAAVEAAGLADTLSGPGPFTVFAPTDAAFAALPAGTLDNLLLPENQAQLTSILTYHVLPGAAPAAALPVDGRARATTVQGESVLIDTRGGTVRINDATVVTPDVTASNGVIHVVDQVLLP